MTTPSWTAGTLYSPGAVVQRTTAPPVVAAAPVNADFEDGDSGWTKEAPWEIGEFQHPFTGTWLAHCTGTEGDFRIYGSAPVPVTPGLSITGSCMVYRSNGGVRGQVQIEWLTSGLASISIVNGNLIDSGEDKWKQSTFTAAIAPATAAYMRIGATAHIGNADHTLKVDGFKWNYAYSPPIDALIFTAVQAAPGYSGGVEPVWPDTLGNTVVDNEVTWEAIDSSTVTWEASPILVSGPNEPTFPLEVGATVADNTIVWTAVSRRVEDEKCPNTAVVVIAASKIFAGDDDIIPFSATVNPLDWSTTDDAGYLPFGLQTHGANPVAALNLYRSNVAAFNSTGFQMWQVDPDPQQMALLDAAPIGSRYHRSMQPFQNDLVFLSEVGIRNLSIAGASTNLEAGGFGKPVDPIVREKIAAEEFEVGSTFVPEFGQYWAWWGPEVLVMTTLGPKQTSWSRYVFPADLDTTTLQGGDLYIRTTDDLVWRLDVDETADDVYCQPTAPLLFCNCADESLTSELTWYESEFETPIVSYRILRSKDGSLFVEIDSVAGDVLTYTDTTVEAGHSYRYVVIARPDDSGIDSEPSNIVICEFEAAEVPVEGSSAPTSEPPEEGEPDCFDLYTAESDLTRGDADGFLVDPELQFETEAGKTYWMYGHITFAQANAAQSPGAQVNFSHAGDTVAFQFMGARGNGFDSTLTTNNDCTWEPIDATRMASEGHLAGTSVSTETVFHTLIDCILKVGDSGGTFAVNWGIATAGAGGSTTRQAGSYITAIEVLDEGA